MIRFTVRFTDPVWSTKESMHCLYPSLFKEGYIQVGTVLCGIRLSHPCISLMLLLLLSIVLLHKELLILAVLDLFDLF